MRALRAHTQGVYYCRVRVKNLLHFRQNHWAHTHTLTMHEEENQKRPPQPGTHQRQIWKAMLVLDS